MMKTVAAGLSTISLIEKTFPDFGADTAAKKDDRLRSFLEIDSLVVGELRLRKSQEQVPDYLLPRQNSLASFMNTRDLCIHRVFSRPPGALQ
ncbi:hypothetical protein ANO14919_063300 [Xylariales sp. No.14919]|nr:hypothetical protein ANO14919_063300 [Xylariales sp. No.14919]